MSESNNESMDDLVKKIDKFGVGGLSAADSKQKCLKLCQNILVGNWIHLKEEDIEVNRLFGGYSNQLFSVKISDSKRTTVSSEPQEVVIRFSNNKNDIKIFDSENPRFSDSIVAIYTSQNDSGPKLYGLFDGGVILHYYEHKTMSDSLFDESLLSKFATKLARFHAMNVPISKQYHNWYQNYINSNLDYKQFAQIFKEYKCETILNYDLKSEIEWLEECNEECDSPLVFSHNELNPNNVLVINGGKDIILCDFDYCGYTNRGIDFGTIFYYWGTNEKSVNFPDLSFLKQFINCYNKECDVMFGKEYSDNELNSVDHILKEALVLSMIIRFLHIIFMVTNDETNGLPLDKQSAMDEIGITDFNQFFPAFDNAWCASHLDANATIYSDSRAALQALAGPYNSNPLVQECWDSLSTVAYDIKFVWVKAHIGILGNEAADEAAKAASTQHRATVYNEVAISLAKRLIREKNMSEWAAEYANATTGSGTRKWFPTLADAHKFIAYADATFELTQIITGHGFHKEYLKRFHITTDDICPCDGRAEQSFDHLIHNCPKFAYDRHNYTLQCGRQGATPYTFINANADSANAISLFTDYVSVIVRQLKNFNNT